jgi:hypothetical protein
LLARAQAVIERDGTSSSRCSVVQRRRGRNGAAATPFFVRKCLGEPHPRSDDMTPCVPQYLRSLITDYGVMPPRDPNDDDDDENEDRDEQEEEEDEPPVVREPDEE